MSSGAKSTSERVCPILAGSGIVRGRKLSLRTPTALREVIAPARYLRPLHDWCDGQRTLPELRELACKAWGVTDSERWMAFIEDLLSAGLLVDARHLLFSASSYAEHPSPWGYSAPRDEWPSIAQAVARQWNSGEPWDGGGGRAAVPVLDSLVQRRHSARGFAVGQAVAGVSIDALSWALAGTVCDAAHRTHPSAGALFALRLRVLILQDCAGWRRGIHHVGIDAQGRLVRHLAAELPGDWLRAFIQPHRLTGAAGVVLLGADLHQPSLKYRNRSYPYALIEAGTALQNAALACAETGLGFHVFGGYDDRVLGKLCALPSGEQILACAVFGPPGPPVQSAQRLAFDFRWATPADKLPFHVARIDLADRSVAGVSGWGRDGDPRVAAARALGEAVERLAWKRPSQLREATALELRQVVPPDVLVSYSVRQRASAAFPFERFEPAARRWWCPVHRLGSGEQHWVPAEFVFHSQALPASATGRLLTRSTSSGCASHPDLDTAHSNALCELVERDAFMRHWVEQRPGRRVSPTVWPDSIVLRSRRLADAGCETLVAMLEGDFPVWLVGLRCDARGFFSVGAATSWDRVAAMERAFTEAETAARTRLEEPTRGVSSTSIRDARDHAELFAQRRHYRRADVLFGSEAEFHGWEDWPASLAQGLQILAGRGREVFFADLTLADAPLGFDGRSLHTVRALVPGLVPIAFGRSPLPLGMVRAAPGGRFPHPFP